MDSTTLDYLHFLCRVLLATFTRIATNKTLQK